MKKQNNKKLTNDLLTNEEKELIISDYLNNNKSKKEFLEVLKHIYSNLTWGALAVGNITITGMFSYICGIKPSTGAYLLLVVSMVSSIIFSYAFMKNSVDYYNKNKKK